LTLTAFALAHLLSPFFFFSSRRRHTRFSRDWSSDVCSSDLNAGLSAKENSAANRADLRPRRAIDAGSDMLRLAENDAVVHAQSTRENRVGRATTLSRLLDVQPLARGRVRAKVGNLVRMQVHHIVVAAIDANRTDLRIRHLRRLDSLVDQIEGEDIRRGQRLVVRLPASTDDAAHR